MSAPAVRVGPTERSVRDLRHELRALDGRPVHTWIGERLRTALGFELGGTYALHVTARGVDVSQCSFDSSCAGEGAAISHAFVDWCQRRGALWGTYDPMNVDPAQRDRMIVAPAVTELIARRSPWGAMRREHYPILAEALKEFFTPLGIAGRQARALLCDGPRLMAWVGCLLRRPPPARALAAFRAVTPAIRARFLIERRLEEASVAGSAIDAALEAIPTAAFLLVLGRRVLHANRLGRMWLDRADKATRATLLTRRGPDPTRFEVNRLAGADGHALALLRAPPDELGARLGAAARRWRLTGRETEVLRWLARGASNARIAAELGCADGTVEIHVSRILAKADAESRGEVIARVWSGATQRP